MLRDGTTVRVLALDSSPGEPAVYRVQVVRSSAHIDDGLLGTIRGCWLVLDTSKSVSIIDGEKSTGTSLLSQALAAGRRTPVKGLSSLAAMSRAAATVLAPEDSPEADLRDRISQILSSGTSSKGHSHPPSSVSMAITVTDTTTSAPVVPPTTFSATVGARPTATTSSVHSTPSVGAVTDNRAIAGSTSRPESKRPVDVPVIVPPSIITTTAAPSSTLIHRSLVD